MPTSSVPPILFPSKSDRDAYIRHHAQGFVVGFLLYKSAVPNSGTFNFDYRTINGVNTPVLNVELKLPYTLAAALKSGCNFVDNLVSQLKTPIFPPSVAIPAPANSAAAMPADPAWVTSWEKYLVWLAQELEKISIDPLAMQVKILNTPTATFDIVASLPYDAAIYADSKSIFQAIKPVVAPTPAPTPTGGGTNTPPVGTIRVDDHSRVDDLTFFHD